MEERDDLLACPVGGTRLSSPPRVHPELGHKTPPPQLHLWLPLLLHIEQGDRFRIPQQQAAGAGIEDLIAVGHLHFLSDLILQVLDKELWGKRWAAVKVRAQEHPSA